MTWHSPLPMFWVASVAINAGILICAIKIPLTSPTTSPIPRQKRMTIHIGYLPVPIKVAHTIPANPTVEPTDISISPRIITMVKAQASIIFVDTDFKIFRKLSFETNLSDNRDTMTHRARSPNNGPRFI